MRIGNFGNSGFGRHEEPSFNHKLFQVGTAAQGGRKLHRRRTLLQVGRFFSHAQKTPEVVQRKGIFEQLRIGAKNLNEWAPAGGFTLAVIGALLFDQCRANQIAGDVRTLKEKSDKADEKLDTRFDKADDKVDARFDKADDKLDARFDKVDAKFVKAEEKVDARFDKADEKVDARFDEVDARFDKLEAILESIRLNLPPKI